jgi:hypothetical protein
VKSTDKTSLKAFAKTWQETGPLLEVIRNREVSALTEEEARQQTLTLLALWKPGFNRPTSGLIQQQEGFRKLEEYLNREVDK